MAATINYNILGGTYGVDACLDALHVGGNALVMDDINLALQIKEANPKAVVVHRSYHQDDSQWFQKISPQEWVNNLWNFANYGIVVQCHNEPVVTEANVDAFVKWNVDMLKRAHTAGMAVAVGGFAVGNPDTRLVSSGAFDAMLKELKATDALNLHEYFIERPTSPEEKGWLCGRLEVWVKRMALLHTACRTIVVGEYGRDVGGGLNDGWRSQGWSSQDYATRLIQGMREIYAPLAQKYSFKIAVNIFCAGRGYGDRWKSFNVEGELDIYKALKKWNEEQAVAYDAGTLPSDKIITQAVNLRVDPNGALIRTLNVGEHVTVYAAPAVTLPGSELIWLRVTVNGVSGWSAKNAYPTPCWQDAPTSEPSIEDVIQKMQEALDLAKKVGAAEPKQTF